MIFSDDLSKADLVLFVLVMVTAYMIDTLNSKLSISQKEVLKLKKKLMKVKP